VMLEVGSKMVQIRVHLPMPLIDTNVGTRGRDGGRPVIKARIIFTFLQRQPSGLDGLSLRGRPLRSRPRRPGQSKRGKAADLLRAFPFRRPGAGVQRPLGSEINLTVHAARASTELSRVSGRRWPTRLPLPSIL
jgi:hypothetical protein